MRGTVYNSAIPDVILKSVNCASRSSSHRSIVPLFIILGLTIAAHGADWNASEQQLARKIVAVTGPGAVAVSVENRSSLSKRDGEIVRDGLRSALESLGLRFVKAEQSAA